MLGSCSSSDDLNGGNTPANQDGNGYVAFTINLPSQSGSSSRAGSSENDQFNDGMAKEYSVQDATLILFNGGTTEGESSFVEAHNLSTAPWQNVGTETDNITTQSKKIVQKVTKSIINAKALVILNNNGTLIVGEDGSLKVNDTNFNGTYADFLAKAEATKDKTLTKDGFYMANAPLANGKGGVAAPATGTTVTTLTDLTNNIYDTEAEAKAGTPAEVYVERGVVKVTLNKGEVVKADNGTTEKVDFAISGWAIDNTNPTTYLVRSTDGFTGWMGYANEKATTNPYRFVGHTAVADNLYRTYFAKDMNYDTDATGVTSLQRVKEADFKDTYGDTNPQYCFENTFNVAHQNENQTTLVAIKAKLNGGTADFYIVGGDQTKLFNKTQLENLIKAKFLSVEEGWVKANAKDAATTIGGEDLTLAFDKDAAGEINLTGVTVKSEKLKDSPEALPATYLADVQAAVGSIVCYKNGVSYYTVRIKHFGDDLTPWKKGELGVAAGSVYPGTKAEENWLGRYGVLRNNWYDITVEGVKGLGSATVPKLTGTTDDELDSYIAVRINVLSWAKRTQNATLH